MTSIILSSFTKKDAEWLSSNLEQKHKGLKGIIFYICFNQWKKVHLISGVLQAKHFQTKGYAKAPSLFYWNNAEKTSILLKEHLIKITF